MTPRTRVLLYATALVMVFVLSWALGSLTSPEPPPAPGHSHE
ncbi:hypothetical protein ACFQ1S_24960 [Kibdelosporangium lantanae]|uniref:Uncharacterized protein n=1 Tax=Kibdelosporangium lantanae TaxID=1497396 RepID=A0ABW3MHA1_9PSEU